MMRENPTLSDSVGMYLESVADHDLLTAEDEVRLARAMERGRKAQRRIDGWMTEGAPLDLVDRSWSVDEAIRRVERRLEAG